MKQLLTIIVFAMILTACGAGTGGSAKIDIKVGGKDVSLETKTSGTYKNVKTFTDINGKATTATTFQVGLANYEMDPATPLTMSKPLTSPDQVRLMIQLVGEEGTDSKSEFKPGIYKADPQQKYMSLNYLAVFQFADGKETNTNFDTSFSASKITGQVEIKSVTADTVSGTIDVTEGDKSVKGSFTAKIAVKK
ncbi:MAG TPA: hypothetical protein PLP07_02495 [Pyrinomonadaceae bacterium]|nr:hypothetical protein [Chloracidobacterium sp.]MBP9935747.1 hypothetical protein [Pyrinomonadaceae bacterium]MBK9436622.1 hypothetical protein [Chloracidobacterium sp.]MBL0241610.1 hypothetical protein [Chloracidobacterium sp.]HQX54769.1 hypothetical protein [Pyrinomonadaceae bacterium]